MIDIIQKSRYVFIVSTGRSKLVGKMFAMRLMHGFTFNAHRNTI